MVDAAADDFELLPGDTQSKKELITSFEGPPLLLLLLIEGDADKRRKHECRSRSPSRKGTTDGRFAWQSREDALLKPRRRIHPLLL